MRAAELPQNTIVENGIATLRDGSKLFFQDGEWVTEAIVSSWNQPKEHLRGNETSESDTSLICMADVAVETVSWLWLPYIPKG